MRGPGGTHFDRRIPWPGCGLCLKSRRSFRTISVEENFATIVRNQTMRHWTFALLCAGGLAGLFVNAAPAEDPKAADPGTLIVIDGAGKEVKLKSWTFTQGVEHLSWLNIKAEDGKKEPAPPKGPKRGPSKEGPEAFAFRELESTTFKDGIVTMVPLDRVRAVDYDTEKQTVTIRVATSDKPAEDASIVGSTEYKGINKITLEAEVDKGDLGVAEVKFLGGAIKGGIRGLRFAPPKVSALPAGRPANLVINDGKKPTANVSDVQALYRLGDGSERLSPLLFFKKTIKIDIAKIKKLSFGGKDGEDVTLTPKEGEEATFTPLKTVMLDGKEAELVGLLARVPAGYRLFPLHTISEIEFDVEKKAETDKKPDEDKKPDDKPEKLRKP